MKFRGSLAGSSSSVKVLSAAAAARALDPAAARHARGEWRSLGCRRAGVRRAKVGARWRCRTWSSGCVRWHEQLQARGGVVEDDGVERRSGAAASAAPVVQHDGQRAADPLPNTDPDPLPAVAATEKGWEETFFRGGSGCVFGSVFA